MSQRLINIGTRPNTKNGDTVRHAFDLVNQNFTEIYTALGQSEPNGIITPQLTVNGLVTVNTLNGALRVRGSEPLGVGVNPNDAPHIHIETTDPTTAELFLGDDSQFVRFATDGSIIVNARLGVSAPVIVKGSDGVLTNNGTAIDNISLQGINLVITVHNHGLYNNDKVYFQDVQGTIELDGNSYYVTNVDGDNFELIGIDSNPVLSSDVSAWVPDTGAIYSATIGGDVVINAGGLVDAYGDEGVVEVYSTSEW
jgi:hypothetical protein